MRISDKIEQNLELKNAKCYESESKRCNDNISKIYQLLNIVGCNTMLIKSKCNDFVLQEQDTKYNVLNFKEQKNVKLREGITLQDHFKDSIGAINDNNIHNTYNNKTVVNDIY